jgi:hypothetical protein
MELVSVVLSTEIGVTAAVPVLIVFGAALRAGVGRVSDSLERRLSSLRGGS